ncbi:MAG: hypothetical protein V7K21_21935 [Nostoc sp.]|uniref:hypothetical protein n=1 Tax=Nostoc sp. TaxID=1180 RepID=UPI002FF63EBD
MTLAACGTIIATIPINAAFAAPTDPSSYPAFCRNIGVAGATLTASCRRINGTYNSTSILIKGIYKNGVLRYS